MSEQTPKPVRYAAYVSLLRFLGRTYDTREAAVKDAKDAGVKKFEIREV